MFIKRGKTASPLAHKSPANIWWLSATSFLTDVSSEMIFPVLPLFLKSVLGVSLPLIGLIEGLAEGLGSVLKYFSGFWSDQLGKRKGLTFLGYILSAFSKLLFALAGGASTVLVARSLDRAGKGIRTAPRDALIAESVAKGQRGKYFGFHRAADTGGAIVGTLIAIGLLYWWGGGTASAIRLILILSFIPAILSTLLLIKVKEVGPAVPSQRRQRLFQFGKLSGNFKIFLLVAALFGLANYSYAFYVLRADDVGLAFFLIPVVYLLYNIFYGLSVYPAGRLSDKVGRKPLLTYAFILFALLNLGFAFAVDRSNVWFWFALYGLFIGLTDGVFKAAVADLANEEREGEAFGIYHTVIGFTTLGGNLLGGWLWAIYGAAWSFALSSLLILLAAVVLVAKVRLK